MRTLNTTKIGHWVILLLFPIPFMLACSTNEKDIAEKQMERTIKELAKDPNVQISNVKTVFETDSIFVFHCDVRGINGFGGYSLSTIEYIYGILDSGKRKEFLQDLNENKPIIKGSKQVYKGSKADNLDSIPNIEEQVMRINIVLRLCLQGREVE